jgi:hypothetical protein
MAHSGDGGAAPTSVAYTAGAGAIVTGETSAPWRHLDVFTRWQDVDPAASAGRLGEARVMLPVPVSVMDPAAVGAQDIDLMPSPVAECADVNNVRGRYSFHVPPLTRA